MEFLTDGILSLTWQQIVMFAVGIALIWLAIKKGLRTSPASANGLWRNPCEPALLRSSEPDSGRWNPGERRDRMAVSCRN